MFTPLKSSIKYFLSAGIIALSFSSCADEVAEETQRNAFSNEKLEKVQAKRQINISNFQDTVVYPVDPINGTKYMERSVGSWYMDAENPSAVDYNLWLYEDGTFEMAASETFVRGRVTGTWYIDADTNNVMYLHLDYNEKPSTESTFVITSFSDNEIELEGPSNSYTLYRKK